MMGVMMLTQSLECNRFRRHSRERPSADARIVQKLAAPGWLTKLPNPNRGDGDAEGFLGRGQCDLLRAGLAIQAR
jgi:hypothetical protein